MCARKEKNQLNASWLQRLRNGETSNLKHLLQTRNCRSAKTTHTHTHTHKNTYKYISDWRCSWQWSACEWVSCCSWLQRKLNGWVGGETQKVSKFRNAQLFARFTSAARKMHLHISAHTHTHVCCCCCARICMQAGVCL